MNLHFSFSSPVVSDCPLQFWKEDHICLGWNSNNLFEKSNINQDTEKLALIHIFSFLWKVAPTHLKLLGNPSDPSTSFCFYTILSFLLYWLIRTLYIISASIITWHTLRVYVYICSKFALLIKSPLNVLGPTLVQYVLILTWLHLRRPYFKLGQVHSYQMVGLEYMFTWDVTQFTTLNPFVYHHFFSFYSQPYPI